MSRFLVTATWADCPHLDEQAKADQERTIKPYQRAARTRGVPQLGSGAIYPIPEDEVAIKPFEIPKHWPRGYGLDVGWSATAIVYGALDRETNTRYIYDAWKRGESEPAVIHDAVRGRGLWVPGKIDPAARGRTQTDGEQLIATLRERIYGARGEELLTPADNAVEAGLYTVLEALSTGKLRIFSTLSAVFAEYRLYRRDEKGHVVKKNDHLMDALRYLVQSGIDWLRVFKAGDDPTKRRVNLDDERRRTVSRRGRIGGGGSWMR